MKRQTWIPLLFPILISACEQAPEADDAVPTASQTVALAEGDDPPLVATTTGNITIVGAVRDSAGQHVPVPGVKISISGAASGSAFTNSDGVYRFQKLPAGTYTMTASKAGATLAPATRTFSLTGDMVRGIDCVSGCGQSNVTNDDLKELVIVDPSVTNDRRASNATGPTTPHGGPWSFRFLLHQMTPPGVDPVVFVETWLKGFVDTTGFGRFRVLERSVGSLTDPQIWPRGADGKLDLAKAPFQLLAIVNRTDLHKNGNGEGRLVFGLKADASAPQPNQIGLFTIIFEYRLPTRGSNGAALSRLDWVKRFNGLRGRAFGEPYNNALQAVTDQFVKAGTDPSAPNRNSISQVRTNEIHMGFPWQLREFHLIKEASGKGFLKLAQVAGTPDESMNRTLELANFVRSQRVNIIGGFATVPSVLIGGQSNENFDPWQFPDQPDIDAQARKAFAGQTCNGCHNGEAPNLDGFYQITPNPRDSAVDRLAGFIKDIEIPRRRRWVQNRLGCATNLSDCSSGSEPMVMPDFIPAGP